MTLNEIRSEIRGARGAIEFMARDFGTTPKVYLHWTAGRYDQDFGDYHISIHGDGTIAKTRNFDERPTATWRRNSGSIAITLDACYNARPEDMGDYPPTDEQIEVMAMVVAAVCDELGVEITKDNVMTHAEVAALDGYDLDSGDPDCRWDLLFLQPGDEWGSGGDTIRGKAIFYQNQEE